MSRTGTDKETRGDEYCLKRTDFETCRKSVWSPERRERLVSPIGDRLRVTRNRVMRNRQSLTPRRSCIVLPLLAKRLIRSFSLQNRSLREESRQEVVKIETQTAPDHE